MGADGTEKGKGERGSHKYSSAPPPSLLFLLSFLVHVYDVLLLPFVPSDRPTDRGGENERERLKSLPAIL